VFEGLDSKRQETLLRYLEGRYSLTLPDDRAKFARPWLDPAMGFGRRQRELLTALDSAGDHVHARHIIRLLWPGNVEAKHLARLRQLVHSSNARLDRLGYYWRVIRPTRGTLGLTVLSAGRILAA
jgi:hypothetical protein